MKKTTIAAIAAILVFGAAAGSQISEYSPREWRPVHMGIVDPATDPIVNETIKDRRDLYAQEDMAYWAMVMAWATVASVMLGGVSVFLLWRTVVHTREAAKHAEASVHEAREATKQAANAADGGRRLLVAERGWLTLDSKSFRFQGQSGGYITTSWMNTGRSPVTDIVVYSAFEIVDVGTVPAAFPVISKTQSRFTVAVGEQIFTEPKIGIQIEFIIKLIQGECDIFTFFRIEYRDVIHSDAIRTSEVAYKLSLKSTNHAKGDLEEVEGLCKIT